VKKEVGEKSKKKSGGSQASPLVTGVTTAESDSPQVADGAARSTTSPVMTTSAGDNTVEPTKSSISSRTRDDGRSSGGRGVATTGSGKKFKGPLTSGRGKVCCVLLC